MDSAIFISYESEDKNKMKALYKAISKKYRGFKPIVVANRRNPGMALTDKVKKGIEDADYFIPIITRNSILSQWVNQEIGYAIAKDKEIVPICEDNIRDKLKGFIHNQLELFAFEGCESDRGREASQFRNCYSCALEHSLLRIIEPKEEYVSDEYMKVSGGGASPDSAIILVTSLDGKYLSPQQGSVTADEDGNWEHPSCHLLHPDRKRLVYALSVDKRHEEKVRKLLQEQVATPTDKPMDKFAKVLNTQQVRFRLTPAIRLVRHKN